MTIIAANFPSRLRRILPPGPAYLLGSIIPNLVLLPGVAYLLLKSYEAVCATTPFPVWVYVAVILGIHPAAIALTSIIAQANRRGVGDARELSQVQASSSEIIRDVKESFANGYPGDQYWAWALQYGKAFALSIYGEPRIFTFEPDDVKALLATQFTEFCKGPILSDALSELLGTGVFNTDDAMWKFHRGMTRPFFNKERISDFDNFERHATAAIALAKERLKEGHPVDFQDVVSRFTLDSATEFLFGQDVDSLSAGLAYPPNSGIPNEDRYDGHPSNTFVKAFVKAQWAVADRARMGKTWALKEFWRNEATPHRKIIDEYVEPLMNEAFLRKAEGKISVEKNGEQMNLLNSLVLETDDRNVIMDALINILVAGRDTTASLLTFAVYALTRNSEVTQKLREEILSVVGQRVPTYDDLRGMKYLRAVLNETLRLYPAVPLDSRTSRVATTLPGDGGKPYHVPAYAKVTYGIFWIHRRTDLWGSTALTFDPDRFIDERVKLLTKNPFMFLPFNAGPRICLGQQFAYNEASYFLVRLLQNFSSISIAEEAQPLESRTPAEWMNDKTQGSTKAMDTIRFGIHLTMYAKGGLWVRMEENESE